MNTYFARYLFTLGRETREYSMQYKAYEPMSFEELQHHITNKIHLEEIRSKRPITGHSEPPINIFIIDHHRV